MIKSGSDFRDFSEITVNFLSTPPTFDVVRHTVTSDVPPDLEVAAIVDNYCASMQEMMKEQIGRLVVPLWPLYSPMSPHIQCIVTQAILLLNNINKGSPLHAFSVMYFMDVKRIPPYYAN